MIFSHSKGMYVAVLSGVKELTTRIRLPAHIAMDRVEAIVPGRAKPAWWFDTTGSNETAIIYEPRACVCEMYGSSFYQSISSAALNRMMRDCGYVQAKIATRYWWQNRLQDMTSTEAKMEGVATVRDYAALWDSINTEAGWRWRDNPLVWRIRFRRTEEVVAAIEKVGLSALKAA